jgi:hypothetical protein
MPSFNIPWQLKGYVNLNTECEMKHKISTEAPLKTYSNLLRIVLKQKQLYNNIVTKQRTNTPLTNNENNIHERKH